MSLIILFEQNTQDINNESERSFNNFPIRKLKRDTTIILGTNFNQDENKKFIKEINIRGLQLVEVINERNLKKISHLNVKYSEKENLNFEETPTLYYKNFDEDDNNNGYKLSYMCKNCRDPCVKKNYVISKNMKPPEFCSDKCILEYSSKESDFENNSKVFQVDPNNHESSVYESLASLGSKKSKFSQFHKKNDIFFYMKEPDDRNDKFQKSMEKEAIRLQYAEKREKYKKKMRQISTRKSNTSISSKNSFKKDRKMSNKGGYTCKAVTKKGVPCTNKSLSNSDFCGISSHRKQINKDIPEEVTI